jgi:serine/threonine-protein kinase
MEYLEGVTLAKKLQQNGRMSPAEAAPILRQIADGLDAAHRAG